MGYAGEDLRMGRDVGVVELDQVVAVTAALLDRRHGDEAVAAASGPAPAEKRVTMHTGRVGMATVRPLAGAREVTPRRRWRARFAAGCVAEPGPAAAWRGSGSLPNLVHAGCP